MGASNSKERERSEKQETLRKGRRDRWHSTKEKYNSADSQAPLAAQDARLDVRRSSTVESQRHRSTAESYATVRSSQHRYNDIDGGGMRPTATTACITQSFDFKERDEVHVDDQEGHSNVTRPPPPARLVQLDELIDPETLPIDTQIRSPSGTLLGFEQFLVHPNRPRSIRERQEYIMEKVRAASRVGHQDEPREEVPLLPSIVPEDDGLVEKRRSRCWGLSCFGSA